MRKEQLDLSCLVDWEDVLENTLLSNFLSLFNFDFDFDSIRKTLFGLDTPYCDYDFYPYVIKCTGLYSAGEIRRFSEILLILGK